MGRTVINETENKQTIILNDSPEGVTGGYYDSYKDWHGFAETPTGEISISQNGVYNVAEYASANVQVQGGITPLLGTLTIVNNTTKSVEVEGFVQTRTIGDEEFLIKNEGTSTPAGQSKDFSILLKKSYNGQYDQLGWGYIGLTIYQFPTGKKLVATENTSNTTKLIVAPVDTLNTTRYFVLCYNGKTGSSNYKSLSVTLTFEDE